MEFQEIACVEAPASAEAVIEAAYWRANPDARDQGLSAAEHFLHSGQSEGRKQAINQAEVSALREQKLARLRFRRPPTPGRAPGEAMNFLTEDLVREFRIPPHPPISDHSYDGFVADLQRQNPASLFLDLGAGLRSTVSSNMVNIDVFPAISTDVVCVGEDLPFEDDQFDFVLCAAVLEHTRRPWDVAREMCRVLKPGGTLRVDYPFISPVHGFPSHYFNATPEGVVSLFERYCDIQGCTVESNNHPIHGLWWILALWREGLFGDDRKTFDSLTIAQILHQPAESHLESRFCSLLDDGMLRIIPAGSTLVATKKPFLAGTQMPEERALRAEAEALREELRLVRASTSWKITAPIRSALSRLRSVRN